jgi:hypothetical protein
VRRSFGGLNHSKFREPSPSVTYAIHDWGYDSYGDDLVHDLHAKGLAAFRRCTEPGEHVLVLDEEHDYFRVWPHETRELWFFANGETILTLASDYRFGTYSTFWSDDDVFCVFGRNLIDAFLADPPRLLSSAPIRRRN